MQAQRVPRSRNQTDELCDYFASVLADKKAEQITKLDLRDVDSSPADIFLICTCNSDVQVRSVAEAIVRAGKDAGQGMPKSEGWEALQWIIVDYFDVVLHIMHKDARAFYKLERLWGDAEATDLSASDTIKIGKASAREEL